MNLHKAWKRSICDLQRTRGNYGVLGSLSFDAPVELPWSFVVRRWMVKRDAAIIVYSREVSPWIVHKMTPVTTCSTDLAQTMIGDNVEAHMPRHDWHKKLPVASIWQFSGFSPSRKYLHDSVLQVAWSAYLASASAPYIKYFDVCLSVRWSAPVQHHHWPWIERSMFLEDQEDTTTFLIQTGNGTITGGLYFILSCHRL